jgi:cyclic pyranopterin phosphate synthase
MPEHGVPYEDQTEILNVAEITRFVRLLAQHGLRKVRLTGGEPLVRAKDVVALVREFAQTPGIEDIGLTTNAVLLPANAAALKDAGLRRINVSLDTLRRERFQQIARFAKFDESVAGLEAAREAGFDPIKLNMVVMKGVNDDEIADFAALTFEHPYHVRFLEYMPIGQVTPFEWRAKYFSNEAVVERLRQDYDLIPIETAASSTAKRFQLPGAKGWVEAVSPISHRFCAGCNRLRLTANGALVPCLADNYEYDLKTPLRAGASDDELLAHVASALSHKPEQSDFEGRAQRGGSLRIMAQIGG